MLSKAITKFSLPKLWKSCCQAFVKLSTDTNDRAIANAFLNTILNISNIVNKFCLTLFCHLAAPFQKKFLWACCIVRRGLKRKLFWDICHLGRGGLAGHHTFLKWYFSTIHNYYWIAKTYFARKTALGVIGLFCYVLLKVSRNQKSYFLDYEGS